MNPIQWIFKLRNRCGSGADDFQAPQRIFKLRSRCERGATVAEAQQMLRTLCRRAPTAAGDSRVCAADSYGGHLSSKGIIRQRPAPQPYGLERAALLQRQSDSETITASGP